MLRRAFVLLLLTIAAQPTAWAAEDEIRLHAKSGKQRNTLVELYTSEGCSSCPPADRWLSSLEGDSRLWHDIVPLALHVDYWDYIGWPDRFASAEFSQRQRQLAIESGARSVYTPGMFANGDEWLGWRRGARVPADDQPTGELEIRLSDNTLAVDFSSDADLPEQLVVYVGVLGMNLSTEVRAGENRGRRLQHDFVLLDLTTAKLSTDAGGVSASARVTLADTVSASNAIVAWVAPVGELTPLQATGGYVTSQ